MAVNLRQLQPQPPPAPPSPPMAPSRTGRKWPWYAAPNRGSNCIAAWLSRPRCHGLTVAQLPMQQAKMKATHQRITVTSARKTMLPRALSQGIWRMQGVVAGALCVGLGAACVGTGVGVPAPPESGSAVPRTWPEIQAQILDPQCAQLCHRGGASPKGLSLENTVSLQNLVGVASAELPSMLRVAPGKPDDSYLIVKLAAADPRRVGARMPRTGPPFLTGAQLSALRKWIAAGATTDWRADAADAGATVVPAPEVDAGDAQEEL